MSGQMGKEKLLGPPVTSFAPSPHAPSMSRKQMLSNLPSATMAFGMCLLPRSPTRRLPVHRVIALSSPLRLAPFVGQRYAPTGCLQAQPSHTRSDARHLRLARLLLFTIAGLP